MGCEDGHAFMFYSSQTRQAIMIWTIASDYQTAAGQEKLLLLLHKKGFFAGLKPEIPPTTDTFQGIKNLAIRI
jgi:hypothetical protein